MISCTLFFVMFVRISFIDRSSSALSSKFVHVNRTIFPFLLFFFSLFDDRSWSCFSPVFECPLGFILSLKEYPLSSSATRATNTAKKSLRGVGAQGNDGEWSLSYFLFLVSSPYYYYPLLFVRLKWMICIFVFYCISVTPHIDETEIQNEMVLIIVIDENEVCWHCFG